MGIIADNAGTVANQALGNVAKAKIVINDRRAMKLGLKEPVKISTGKTMTVSETTMVNGVATTVKKQVDITAVVLQEVEIGSTKTFCVQFNPNSLTVSGYGGGKVTKTNFGDGGKSLEFEPADVRITMSVRLIFDQVDPQDAFMFDKLNTSLTAVGTGIAKAVRTKAEKKEVSVQKQVEGFIAALRSQYTREISFNWGTMSYFGVLNRVSSQYVMFDVLGKPVRAYVDLSLVCADSGINVGDMGSWQDAYDTAFGDGDQSFVTSSQTKSNLLNYSI